MANENEIKKQIEVLLQRFDPPGIFATLDEKVENTVRWCSENNVHPILVSSAAPLLTEISDAPKILFVLGKCELLNETCIGVVGARRASASGIRAAHVISRKLAEAGFVVVSGLARGIDSAAHRGVLSAVPGGGGRTISVLGHGLDRIYPPENYDLSREILNAGGCLVSEYLPGMPPLKHHFPQRNRIISGLSRGVLVVEATERSGSLITAKLALEQNRDVFALPGIFDDAGCLGNHRLIQDGAKLVVSAEDILDEYPHKLVVTPSCLPETLRPLFLIFKKLKFTASLEALFIGSATPLTELLEILDLAKIQGFVAEVGHQQFTWVGETK